MSSPEEILDVIDEGKSNRHVAVTSEWGTSGAPESGVCLPSVPMGAEGLDSEQGKAVSSSGGEMLVCETLRPCCQGYVGAALVPADTPSQRAGAVVRGSWGLRASFHSLVQGLSCPASYRHE